MTLKITSRCQDTRAIMMLHAIGGGYRAMCWLWVNERELVPLTCDVLCEGRGEGSLVTLGLTCVCAVCVVCVLCVAIAWGVCVVCVCLFAPVCGLKWDEGGALDDNMLRTGQLDGTGNNRGWREAEVRPSCIVCTYIVYLGLTCSSREGGVGVGGHGKGGGIEVGFASLWCMRIW